VSAEPSAPAPAPSELAALVAERERAARDFFERESAGLARACHAMARAFARGAALIPFGTGSAATDAAHAAVEFMHPVIVGKRALPAFAPGSDRTGGSSLAALARPDDIALAISHLPRDPDAAAFAGEARRRGLLTIELAAAGADDRGLGDSGGGRGGHRFAVRCSDPAVAQEVQETAYHVLWELVHVFFERPELLEEACLTCGDVAVRARVVAVAGDAATVELGGARERVATDLLDAVAVGDELLCHAGVALERTATAGGSDPSPAPEPTSLLYPFLEPGGSGAQRGADDLDLVLAEVEASTMRKLEEVIELRAEIDLEGVTACAIAVAERLGAGGRLLAFGNGGSATDAQDLAADALALGWPAAALNDDGATVTAVANDVGFEQVFARQLIALGRPGDVAVAISTSGGSPNLLAALEEARRRGMLTVGLAGYGGGRMAGLGWLDHLLVVGGDHVPRIQEAQATAYHLMLEALGPAPATGASR
jgi:D-sedoheptulose 7-phosphate isomerase